MDRTGWMVALGGAGIGCAAVALLPVSGLAAAIDASVDAEICLVMAGLSLTVLAFLLPHAASLDREAGTAYGNLSRSKAPKDIGAANDAVANSNDARSACLDLLLAFLVFLIGGMMIGAVEANGGLGPDAQPQAYAAAMSRIYSDWGAGAGIDDVLLLADPALTLPTLVMGVILLIAASLRIRSIIPDTRTPVSEKSA